MFLDAVDGMQLPMRFRKHFGCHFGPLGQVLVRVLGIPGGVLGGIGESRGVPGAYGSALGEVQGPPKLRIMTGC